MTRTLLLDADLLAYRASAANQRSYDWNSDGNKSIAADEAAARRTAEDEINRLVDRLKVDDLIVCLSDDFHSFRKERVDATYKAARGDTERPVHLYDLKDWLADNYTTVRWTALEADDVMGIIATDPSRTDERIIASADKDLMQIPGKLYRPQDGKVRDISLEAADHFHMFQTLVGDITDGYPGCPGVGPMRADSILDHQLWVRTERELRSGPRKGETISEWSPEEHDGPVWDRVVAAYARVGLTEADAIKQARLARILRHGEWDGRSPILWKPPSAH